MGKIRIRSRYRGRIPQTIAESASGVDTPTVQITGAGGSDYPNEPAGMSLICHHSCDAAPGAGTATIEVSPQGVNWTNVGTTGMTFVTDATAPVNGPTVMSIKWPQGLQSGVGPGTKFDCRFTPTVTTASTYREVYVSYRFKVVANNGGWEFEPSATKLLGYLSYGKTNRNNQYTTLFKPVTTPLNVESGPWKLVADYTLEYSPEPNGADISQNVTVAGQVALGWNHLEVYTKLNSADLTEDGICRIWVNGVLVTERTDFCFIEDYVFAPYGFYQFHFHPVWGGVTPDTFMQQDNFVYLCDVYCSGVLM